MKPILHVLVPLCFILLSPQISNGQLLKRLSKKAADRVEQEAEKRAEERINKKIDEEFDKAENTIDGEENEGSSDQENHTNSPDTSADENDIQEPIGSNIVWSRYDFVPGDEVLFEDGPAASEETGEFPSRWDLHTGNSEIIEVDGINAIGFPQGGKIVPYLENSKEDYLPEIFTIELDVHFKPGHGKALRIHLYDTKNQMQGDNDAIIVNVNSVNINNTNPALPNKNANIEKNGGWRHVSIAFTKGKLKVYLEDTRLHNIPHYEGSPTGVTLWMDGNSQDTQEDIQYIKNFRIAKGGVKYYDRVLSEGKIVVNGIKFDVNKATLKPESIGPINAIYKLMQKQPEFNFSVEGHTDSDGGDDLNMTLSKARGQAVMDKLIELGISPERLKSDGFGESKPVGDNNSAEGKANNRRVEFVKF